MKFLGLVCLVLLLPAAPVAAIVVPGADGSDDAYNVTTSNATIDIPLGGGVSPQP